ncbi:MAG TPA: YdeI/OmpD-associated family protein [Cellvibrio sp.]|nr:YdeI/OmpD-associated family protein [Cellvibrio sp.]
MSKMNPKVDPYFADGCGRCPLFATPKCKVNHWRTELKQLRNLVLGSGLSEELKWGVPCYTLENNNIVLIHAFKEYCALLFFKGALMKDTKGILIQQTENVQAGRQIRFTNPKEVSDMEATITAYLQEAIAVEEAGLKVEYKKTEAFTLPEEFQTKLNELPELKAAFDALTPGRQRGYLLYFAAPKQSKTRESRIEKYIPKILNGEGLHDV